MIDRDPPVIYLDADACLVRDLVFRAAVRYQVPLYVVANMPLRIPPEAESIARSIIVPGSPDAADDWIAERAGEGDLVLTADIPLAARGIANKAICLDFRGKWFNPNRIGDALAAREVNALLRQMGEITSGPPSYGKRDRSAFASALDAAVSNLARRRLQ